ncbi:hypothetical protein AC578_1521 [Pseudocercospora eumusae]|uniref:Uncharacterized protein n=1 Tax=Pseudocercospora eumusae TaxID=321146 RepID=A0A139GXQ7_9PEZI|nr:hypothetical protein AC578_1521 [Pseudocercospora eumusae]
MASKNIAPTGHHFFQPVNVTTEASHSLLVDVTASLWRQGLDVTFWAHHESQKSAYKSLLLPPYQFEKSRHWLSIKEPSASTESTSAANDVPTTRFSTFFAFMNDAKSSMRFRVNTTEPEFVKRVDAHVMASTVAVMPGMLPVEIAIDAICSLQPQFRDSTYQPELQNMVYYSPLVPQSCTNIWLDFQATDASGLTWEWNILGENASHAMTKYISGLLVFVQPNDPFVKADFARLSRVASYKRCRSILEEVETDNIIAGSNIYRAFEAVIDYKDVFRHLTRLVSRDDDVAGRVHRAHEAEGWLDSVLTDCFCQVGGIGVNLFIDNADSSERNVFIGDRVERWIRTPGLRADPAKPQEWQVMSINHRESGKAFISDVFAFDARDGSLYEAILGIRYSRVHLHGLRETLLRGSKERPTLADDRHPSPARPTVAQLPVLYPQKPIPSTPCATAVGMPSHNGVSATHSNMNGHPPKAISAPSSGLQISVTTREILQNLSGVDVEKITDQSNLIDMGIDSLMAMELVREVDAAFKCTLTTDQLMRLTDVRSLLECIATAMGAEGEAVSGDTSSLFPKESGTAMCNGARSDDGAKLVNGANGNSAMVDADSDASYDSLFPPSTVLNVVRAVTAATDEFIMDHKLGNYYSQVRPRSTMLCAAYIIEAFEKLGCSIKGASPGERVATPKHLPKHDKFMKELYKIIGPQETGLVEIMGESLIRTSISCPDRSASELLQSALQDEPDHAPEFRLIALTGCKLAECLTGEADGLHLIFGAAEGRKIVSDVYAVAPINYTWIKQATFFVQLLLRSLPANDRHINILELGAGTGGTTATIVPMLAALSIPVTYTFTDLSSSLVAAARRRFKQYPFMKFQVLDIESPPEKTLVHSQHIVLANACVHATRSLPVSVRNIHDMLCPDGMLILLEETEQLPWVDFVFGLLEGWWLFEDGRTHAQVSAPHWEQVLRDAGFGHVDYTDGKLRMAQVQRIIFGFASDISDFDPPGCTASFPPVSLSPKSDDPMSGRLHILVTGATGSLGSHLAAAAARMPDVRKVTCLNRLGSVDVNTRQWEAFSMRGIKLEASEHSKLEILSADTSKPMLGLSHEVYETLVPSLTHIIHSAWPMSLTRTTKAYEPQFRTMRGLIDLACKCAGTRPRNFQFSFQFISSIGTVGYYPLWSGRSVVPETSTTAHTALPVGYADAKIVCERMLEKTLRTLPERFRAMSVRIAQITGSRSNAYWNPVEHFSFLIKSSQFLKRLPDLQGTLSWFPVDDVASASLDILMAPASPWPVYHIENPVRQPWPQMIALLAQELDVGIVSYEQWIEAISVCDAPLAENPAKQILEFWQRHFLRMSTGPLVLSTVRSCERSSTMREACPVADELVRRYVGVWRECGFLR